MVTLGILHSLEDARVVGQTGELDVRETRRGQTSSPTGLPLVEQLGGEGGVPADLVVGQGGIDLPCNGGSDVVGEV